MHEKNEILLVEDNPYDAELTIEALRKSNIKNKLLHLQNGEEALEYIFAEGDYADRDLDEKPKLILLDLKMPKLNGLQVLERIKADDRTKNIPVVLLTSSKESKDIADSYKLGANSYVVKPVEFEEFVKVVSDVALRWLSAG